MAKSDSTEPTIARKLSKRELEERTKSLVQCIHEKDELELQKSEQTKKWNAQINLLDEQISQIGGEVRTGTALVPRQLRIGEAPRPEELNASDNDDDATGPIGEGDDDAIVEPRDFDEPPVAVSAGGKKAKRARRPRSNHANA